MQGGYFQHALFNEHTKGDRIKDLSYLNRDLRHVIIVDTNPNSYVLQKHNGIAIKPWDGDLNDAELLNLVPFLEAVFKEDVPDVREVPSMFVYFVCVCVHARMLACVSLSVSLLCLFSLSLFSLLSLSSLSLSLSLSLFHVSLFSLFSSLSLHPFSLSFSRFPLKEECDA